MPSTIYSSAMLGIVNGTVAFGADSFGVMLLDSDYIPDRASHRRRADVQDFEVSGAGYRATDVAIAISMDEPDAVTIILGAGRWNRATINARYAAYYKRNGGAPEDDELIACIDFGRDVISTNGTFALSESRLVLFQAQEQDQQGA